MFQRLTILTCLLALSLALGGCSKCDIWGWQPGSCRGDAPKSAIGASTP